MNRRDLLKGVLGAGTVAVAGKAVADEGGLVPVKAEGQAVPYDELHDKYWQSQAHIDHLELENAELTVANDQLNHTLQIHNNTSDYAEIYHDGTDVVIRNSANGKEFRL